MQTRTDLLNYLIQRYGLRSYCEIGTQNCVNFHAIECEVKIGVDPEPITRKDGIVIDTSDNFFNMWHQRTDKPLLDLIFIDGLHTAEQVKRDFDNALRCLTDNGFIVLHDCLPTEEKYTTIPRETKIWFGDVYKFAMTLRTYPGISFRTWEQDCGCCVIWKDQNSQAMPPLRHIGWDEYIDLGKELLNVVDDIKAHLP